MNYNKGKAEKEWNAKKEKEEKILRAYGVSEDKISSLRDFDWKEFKSNRNYLRWFENSSDIQPLAVSYSSSLTVEMFLANIKNERLLQILSVADPLTLKIIVLRVNGYKDDDISSILNLKPQVIRQRFYRLKKKIKKYF